LVAPQRVIFWHLDKHDAHAVRVGDSHLDQPPGFATRLTQHPHADSREPLMLGREVADLEPDLHASSLDLI